MLKGIWPGGSSRPIFCGWLGRRSSDRLQRITAKRGLQSGARQSSRKPRSLNPEQQLIRDVYLDAANLWKNALRTAKDRVSPTTLDQIVKLLVEKRGSHSLLLLPDGMNLIERQQSHTLADYLVANMNPVERSRRIALVRQQFANTARLLK